MTLSPVHSLIIMLICGACTFAERALPFLIFGSRRVPDIIKYLGRVLPLAVMATLVIYCLRGISFASAAGFVPDNPSELLGSERMGKVLQALAAQYDYVLCDTPPVSAVSDASALSRFVDGAVLVVSHNQVTRQSALAAKAQLESGNVPILGAVLNLYDAKQSSDGGRTYAYYNYEYYGSGDSGTAQPKKRKQAETGIVLRFRQMPTKLLPALSFWQWVMIKPGNSLSTNWARPWKNYHLWIMRIKKAFCRRSFSLRLPMA